MTEDFIKIETGSMRIETPNDICFYLVFFDTGEIRSFYAYNFKGSEEVRRVRALRRACDVMIKELNRKETRG